MKTISNSLFSLEKVGKFTTMPKTLSYSHYCSESLPTPDEVVIGYSINQMGIKMGRQVLSDAVNPQRKDSIYLMEKVKEIYYCHAKESLINDSVQNNVLNPYFTASDVVFGKVKINPNHSAYAKEGIYSNPEVIAIIKVLEGHLCKITRLHNGKIRLEHFTHNPPSNSPYFSYIGNLDFRNEAKGQYKSTACFELSENVITEIAQPSEVLNEQLLSTVMSDRNLVCTLTEQSFFYFSNNGNRESKYADVAFSNMLENMNKLEDSPIYLEFLDLFLGK